MSDLKSINFTGGLPNHTDLPPAIVFLVTYLLVGPMLCWRIYNPQHRTKLLIYPAVFYVCRLAMLIIRLYMTGESYNQGVFIAEYVFVSIGVFFLLSTVIAMWQRQIDFGIPKSEQPMWIGRLNYYTTILIYASIAVSVAGSSMLSSAAKHPEKMGTVNALRQAGNVLSLAIVVIAAGGTLYTERVYHLDWKATGYVLAIYFNIFMVSLYSVIRVFTFDVDSPIRSRAAFWAWQMPFELFAFVLMVAISLPAWFPAVAERPQDRQGVLEAGGSDDDSTDTVPGESHRNKDTSQGPLAVPLGEARATSLAYVDTLYSADSIEWCPFQGYQDIFVCGTYQIIKPEEPSSSRTDAIQKSEGVDDDGDNSDDQFEYEAGPSKPTQRVGRLLVFQVGEDQATLNEIQRIETAAILDTKWSPRLVNGRPSLAVADAKGHITLYSLDPETMKLERDQQVDVADDLTLCLSLDFSHRLHQSSPSSIITSLSSGSLAYLTPSEAGYVVESEWKAHDFEPWITSFDNWDLNTVWSGGDDCKLKRWDIRETFRPTFVNKNFEAGVTTISSSPHTPHLLAVGSYDENLRIFDARSPLEPLTTIPLGGGIWRTRFHPSIERKGDILNACMHDNFKIVRLATSTLSRFDESGSEKGVSIEEAMNGDGWEIVKVFEAHESLAYGADWSRLPQRQGGVTTSGSIGDGGENDVEGNLIASCSFYDHAMHLWRG
ncbi:hypothetical protein IAU59_001606 [Kwoniella sp. CBS 9459]